MFCVFFQGLKKPYNPIIGETFRCLWTHHKTDSRTFYIAEQVGMLLLCRDAIFQILVLIFFFFGQQFYTQNNRQYNVNILVFLKFCVILRVQHVLERTKIYYLWKRTKMWKRVDQFLLPECNLVNCAINPAVAQLHLVYCNYFKDEVTFVFKICTRTGLWPCQREQPVTTTLFN